MKPSQALHIYLNSPPSWRIFHRYICKPEGRQRNKRMKESAMADKADVLNAARVVQGNWRGTSRRVGIGGFANIGVNVLYN